MPPASALGFSLWHTLLSSEAHPWAGVGGRAPLEPTSEGTEFSGEALREPQCAQTHG